MGWFRAIRLERGAFEVWIVLCGVRADMHDLGCQLESRHAGVCERVFICMCVFRQFICNPKSPDLFVFMQQLWTQLQVDQKNTQPTSLFLSLSEAEGCVLCLCMSEGECVEMSVGDEEGGLRIRPPSSLYVKKVYSESAEELQSPEALRSSAMSPDLRQDFNMMEQRKRVTQILQSPVRRHSHTHSHQSENSHALSLSPSLCILRGAHACLIA